MAKHTQSAIPVVTKSSQFFSCGSGNLFSVNPGVPVDDALEQASSFLCSALDLGRESADSEVDYSALYLVEMAYALLSACILPVTQAVSNSVQRSDRPGLVVMESVSRLIEQGALIVNPQASSSLAAEAAEVISVVQAFVNEGGVA